MNKSIVIKDLCNVNKVNINYQNRRLYLSNWEVNSIKTDKIDSKEALKRTYELGELLSETNKIMFERKELEIRNREFSNLSQVQTNSKIIELLDRIVNQYDLNRNDLLLFYPLYKEIAKIIDEDTITLDGLINMINDSEIEFLRSVYSNIIDEIKAINGRNYDSLIEPLVHFIALSDNKFSDLVSEIAYSKKCINAIKKYCLDLGMPYWTNRKEFDEILIDDFIKICILIYQMKNFWDIMIDNLGFDTNYSELIEIYRILQIDISSITYNDTGLIYSKRNAIKLFMNRAIGIDVIVRYNYNCLNGDSLIIYRILNNPTKDKRRLYYVNQHESLIIGVWDYFYMTYLKEDNKDYCNSCGKLIEGKKYKLRKDNEGLEYCEECYRKKRRKDIRDAVYAKRHQNKKVSLH